MELELKVTNKVVESKKANFCDVPCFDVVFEVTLGVLQCDIQNYF